MRNGYHEHGLIVRRCYRAIVNRDDSFVDRVRSLDEFCVYVRIINESSMRPSPMSLYEHRYHQPNKIPVMSAQCAHVLSRSVGSC